MRKKKEDKLKTWEKTAILFGIIFICVAISKIFFIMEFTVFLILTVGLAIITIGGIFLVLRDKIKKINKIPEKSQKYIKFLLITFFLTFFIGLLLVNLYGSVTFDFGFDEKTVYFLTLQILSLLSLTTLLILYLHLYFNAGINIKKGGFVKIKKISLFDIYPLVLIITFFIIFGIAEILDVFLSFKNLYSWITWIFVLLYIIIYLISKIIQKVRKK